MRCECGEHTWLRELDEIENRDCCSRVNRGEMDIHTYYTICENRPNIYCPCILCNSKKSIKVDIDKPIIIKPWYAYICCMSIRKSK